jgi:hypothetical protein
MLLQFYRPCEIRKKIILLFSLPFDIADASAFSPLNRVFGKDSIISGLLVYPLAFKRRGSGKCRAAPSSTSDSRC